MANQQGIDYSSDLLVLLLLFSVQMRLDLVMQTLLKFRVKSIFLKYT